MDGVVGVTEPADGWRWVRGRTALMTERRVELPSWNHAAGGQT